MRLPRTITLIPNLGVHKMWRAHDKEHLLGSPQEKKAYLDAIKNDFLEKCNKSDFKIHSFVIMDNHVHEIISIGESSTPFSNHMRRAHGRFGQDFNQRHNRSGKVAHERPKTKVLQDDYAMVRAQMYADCNPVRAGKIKHPADRTARNYSSCRFYAYGEKNEHTKMLTPPEWYIALAKTDKARQRKYRKMLDQYMRETGLIKDSFLMQDALYAGNVLWIAKMREQLKEKRGTHKPTSDDTSPDTS